MMLADQLLSLARQGVELHAEAGKPGSGSGQLRVRAPEGVLTAEIQTELVERKVEILALLGRYSPPSTAGLAADTRPILRRSSDAGEPESSYRPLSFGQERLWFLDRFESEGREPDTGKLAAYNICGSMRLRGPLDLAALQQSLEELVRRHEVLRTVIAEVEGRPVGRLCPPPQIDLPFIDLEHLGTREEDVRRVAQHEARQPLDLTQCPLLRARIWRLAPDAHILLLVLHHSACDAWSIGVLNRELFALYQAYRTGRPSPLAELPIQYADFAAWQREQLRGYPRLRRGSRVEEQLAFWRHLADAPMVLDLPTDHPVPRVWTGRGANYRFSLSHLEEPVRSLARREEVTPFQVMLAAFQVFLSRYSGQEDFLLGSPIAGRRSETEGLIGFFVNTLVIRADLQGDPSFRDLLQRVRRVALAAYAHSDVPYERVVEELDPPRDRSRTPLVQVTFVEQKVTTPEGLPDLELESYEVGAKVDLSLAIRYWKGGWEGNLEYSTDLFEPDTIERMAGHYCTLLAAATASPEERVSKLPLLTEAEREQLVEWNATDSQYPRDQSIAGRFEEQVMRTPEAIALVSGSPVSGSGEARLTYRQLDERANRLAHELAARGVGRESVVGIFLERSLEMVVGLLGILKAGGAYLPLDPGQPAPRLAFMLADAECSLVLTREHLATALPPFAGQVLCLERYQVEGMSYEQPPHTSYLQPDTSWQSGPEHLAYVMYTSGSTGRPRGVDVCHRNVIRLVCASSYADFGPDQTFLHFAPLAFDASTFEIWGPLLNGARLVICPPQFQSLAELGQVVSQYGVTTLWLTAGLFQQMVEHNLSALAGLRQLLAGGDVLSVPHVQRFLEAVPDCRLINGYGPTEATTFTCCHTVSSDQLLGGTVPIGRPIANTTVHLLDRHGELVPVGVPGEMYIGGDGVARGYRHQPDLTAERFIPNPFGPPGSRLYRTGDQARYRSNGTLEFLGRLDRQMKLRGFRIEPEEVELALAEHPAVREVRVDTRGETLIAYLVSAGEVSEGQLRRYLEECLPRYMVPSAYVFLDALPLTANGKVDLRALPSESGRQNRFVPAETSIHRQLAYVWSELLGVRPIGITDDFFDLGGHSMAAVQLLAMIEDAFGKQLPLSVLFQEATVEHLAEALQASLLPEDISPVVQIQSGNRPPFFFLHAELDGVGFYSRTLARCLGSDQPFYMVQPPGLDGTPVPLTVDAIAARQAEAVRVIRPHGPYLLGGYCAGGFGAIELARQLRQQGEQIDLLVVMHPLRPAWFWLRPLIRKTLGRAGDAMGLAEEDQRDLFLLLLYFKLRLRDWRQLPHVNWRRLLGSIASLRQPDLPGILTTAAGAVLAEDPGAPVRWAVRDYRPKRYPGRVTIFVGEGDRTAADWEGVADDIEVHTVPGDHDSFVEHLPAIAEQLRVCPDTIR